MAIHNRGDIEKLEALIGKLQVWTEPYSQIGELMGEIADVALHAEEVRDMELLQYILYRLMPEVDRISDVYKKLSEGKAGGLLRLEKDRLEAHVRYLPTYGTHNVIHVNTGMFDNVGDYILTQGIRKQVEDAVQEEFQWYSIDILKSLNGDYIQACNRSRAVIIGGGGILADAKLNAISGWMWPCSVEHLNTIQAPIYVLAVGYNRFRGQEDFPECFQENINALVERSRFFGLRNHGSIEAIRGYLREDLKAKIVYHPCPTTVISKLYELPMRGAEEPFIALNCAFDREELRYRGQRDNVMFAVAHVIKKLSANYRIKYYAHLTHDEQMYSYLDEVGVAYEKVLLSGEMSEQEYLSHYRAPELVLAMRGHAQMIPFGCKTPVVSIISHDKLQWFLDDIGHPEWGVEALDERFEDKLLEKALYMLEHREEICTQIEEAQEKLWSITQENLKQIQLA